MAVAGRIGRQLAGYGGGWQDRASVCKIGRTLEKDRERERERKRGREGERERGREKKS
jgi:hypothetical protein